MQSLTNAYNTSFVTGTCPSFRRYCPEIGSKIRCYMSFGIYCSECKNCLSGSNVFFFFFFFFFFFWGGGGGVQGTVSYRPSYCALIRNSWSPDQIRGGVTV